MPVQLEQLGGLGKRTTGLYHLHCEGLEEQSKAAHKHPKVKAWLKRHPRFHLHFTPTSASWLKMVERFFRDLTTRRIRTGIFTSVAQLEAAIADYLRTHNCKPKPFIWTAKASDILAKVTRAKESLFSLRD